MHNELKITDMQTLESNKKTIEESINPISLDLPDFTTDSYKDAYSRINAIVIEGEQEAHDNYISIATLIPNELEELMEANKVNLPLIKKMLDEVADDASVLAMDREELMEEFMIAYQDTLMEIGLDNREIARMAMAAIV